MNRKNLTRRKFITTSTSGLAGLAVLGSAGLTKGCRSAGKSSPNLLFVFPDQMRAQALGFMDQDPVRTPVLDRFAAEGAALTEAVSNYPVCSPFRATLMSGKYAHGNGVLANCNTNAARYGYELKQTERCWSDVLADSGYSLGYIGKWHLDNPYKPYVKCANNRENFAWNEWCPAERRHGFDFWYAYGTYDQHMRPMYWSTDAGRNEARFVDQWGPEHEADLAIEYIKNSGGTFRDPQKPFALVVSMNPPHMPYDQLPDEYVDQYRDIPVDQLCNRPNIPGADERWGAYYRKHIRNYLAMVTGVDEQFGRILAALDEQGLSEDTIVVFTSDHGNCLGIHHMVSKNNHYEESMRVPFIVRWPGRITPRRDDLLISSADIYPTLLGLMGYAADVPAEVQGSSYAGLLTGGRGERPSAQPYIWIPYGQPAGGRRGVRTREYTMVVSREEGQPGIILHDNRKDPYQLENIAPQQSALVESLLKKELNPWLEKCNDPWLNG